MTSLFDLAEKLREQLKTPGFQSVAMSSELVLALIDVVEATIIELDSGDTWDLCSNNQEICPHCDKVKAIKALQNKVGGEDE